MYVKGEGAIAFVGLLFFWSASHRMGGLATVALKVYVIRGFIGAL